MWHRSPYSRLGSMLRRRIGSSMTHLTDPVVHDYLGLE